MITCFDRGILVDFGADGRLGVGGVTTGGENCSTDILGEAKGEITKEPMEEESDNMLPEASLSRASSELSSALSVVPSASPGIRLCLVTFGARSESFMGKGAAKTSARPAWLVNEGLTVDLAIGESGDSGAVVDITGIGMPPNVVRCDSGILIADVVPFKESGRGRELFEVERGCEGSIASLDNEDCGVWYVESDCSSREAKELDAEAGSDGDDSGDGRSRSNATLSGWSEITSGLAAVPSLFSLSSLSESSHPSCSRTFGLYIPFAIFQHRRHPTIFSPSSASTAVNIFKHSSIPGS
jgi:hypothetical protein